MCQCIKGCNTYQYKNRQVTLSLVETVLLYTFDCNSHYKSLVRNGIIQHAGKVKKKTTKTMEYNCEI